MGYSYLPLPFISAVDTTLPKVIDTSNMDRPLDPLSRRIRSTWPEIWGGSVSHPLESCGGGGGVYRFAHQKHSRRWFLDVFNFNRKVGVWRVDVEKSNPWLPFYYNILSPTKTFFKVLAYDRRRYICYICSKQTALLAMLYHRMES